MMLKKLPHLVLTGEVVCGGGYSIYEYIPSLFHPFYYELEPVSFNRRVRFFFELIKGYKVYYLKIGEEIVASCVISRGGGRYSFAEQEDIVVGPYFVSEPHRGNRYSEILVSALLHYSKIKFRLAYDWIRRNNIPSIRCAERVGFVKSATLDVVKPFRRLKIRKDKLGEYYLLIYRR